MQSPGLGVRLLSTYTSPVQPIVSTANLKEFDESDDGWCSALSPLGHLFSKRPVLTNERITSPAHLDNKNLFSPDKRLLKSSKSGIDSDGTSNCTTKSNAITINPIAFNTTDSTDPPIIIPEPQSFIVSPNVERLSKKSSVEIRIYSETECVGILCSKDTVRMKSLFFNDVILNYQGIASDHKTTMMLLKGTYISGSAKDLLIAIKDNHPFDCAALLESMHESRNSYQNVWNATWARLSSVEWGIHELACEIAAQIDAHLEKTIKTIHSCHWRTNPNVLKGYGVISAHNNSKSIVLTSGTVIESVHHEYSKIRVQYEPPSYNKVLSPTSQMTNQGRLFSPNPLNLTSENNVGLHIDTKMSQTSAPTPSLYTSNTADTRDKQQRNIRAATICSAQHPYIGEIAMPFWVRKDETSPWRDPDDIFSEQRNLLTTPDVELFWEMIIATFHYPDLGKLCKGYLKSTDILVEILTRPENRILWRRATTELFPPDILVALVNKGLKTINRYQ